MAQRFDHLYIGGKWVRPQTQFDDLNPAMAAYGHKLQIAMQRLPETQSVQHIQAFTMVH